MKISLPFLLFIVSVAVNAQTQTVLENNPTGLKWYQVNTPHFKVLFPKGFDVQAQRMANTLEYIHAAEAKSLGTKPRKISIVLQNQSSQSNAFVSILPRRSEFYTMPPQDYNFIGTNDWLDLLASHEYRHIVQYQHATRGFNRVFYYLFGNPTLAGMAQISAPQWFWEGDAVATETAFTHSGRGKIPNFNLIFKTNMLEGRTFNYHKQHLRSYKHNIPNHYVLGYNMVSYLRRKTNDPEIWGKITARSWSVPFIPFAFSNAIKKETGLYVKDLYNEMAATFKSEWQREVDQLKLTSFEKVNPRTTSAYTDYLYPQAQEDGSILVMKQGIGDINQFVLLKDGEEKKVFTPGFINDAGMLSSAYTSVVWNEYGYNPRWRVKNYSLIKIYDYKSKQKRVIGGKRQRFGGAALSPKGDKVVTVRSDNDYTNTLMVLEIFSGRPLKEFPNAANNFYSMPRWSEDGSKIVVLKSTRQGKTISVVDAESGAGEDIVPVTQENIGHPVWADKYIFFNSPISGIDNIYAISLETKQRYQVTTSKYGAYNPSISKDGKTIYYNEQAKDGMDVVKIPFDPSAWSVNEGSTIDDHSYQHLVEQEGRPGIFDSIPQTVLPVQRYSKLKGMINPYSWGFLLTNDLAQITAAVASRDILNTTSITAGYVYDINERTNMWQAGISYQGFYPIINLTARTGDRVNDEKAFGNSIEFKWNETTLEGGLSIPLVLTKSKYIQQLSIGNSVGLTRVSSFINTIKRNGTVIYKGKDRFVPLNDTLDYMYKDQLRDGDFVYNHFTLSYYHVLKTSYRDYLYRWGQSLNVDLYNTPFTSDFTGRQLALRGTLYFPGLAKHHYLYYRGAYQKSLQGIETDIYTFRNRIPKPRGYSYPNDEKFYTLSMNYSFPLWYPDIAFGPILNIQRIKLNAFYDYGKGYGKQFYYNQEKNDVYYGLTDDTYQSIGVETTFDFNFMRFLPKFELGFRSSYLKANRTTGSGVVFEILIGNIGF
jgi:hypothetical protein